MCSKFCVCCELSLDKVLLFIANLLWPGDISRGLMDL